MTVYDVETNAREDYGSSHFWVIAKDLKDAWKKACWIEHKANIIKIHAIKELPEG